MTGLMATVRPLQPPQSALLPPVLVSGLSCCCSGPVQPHVWAVGGDVWHSWRWLVLELMVTAGPVPPHAALWWLARSHRGGFGCPKISSCPLIPSSLFPDLDARPWDFQAEECALRASIKRFNSRRYDRAHSNPDFLPVDNCLQSVLGQRVELPEDFQVNYDLWLEREVFSRPISWEELLQ